MKHSVLTRTRSPLVLDLDPDDIELMHRLYAYFSMGREHIADKISLSILLYHYGSSNLENGIINIELLQAIDASIEYIVNDLPKN